MIDKRLLNLLNLERFLVDLMIPSGRKALQSKSRKSGTLFPVRNCVKQEDRAFWGDQTFAGKALDPGPARRLTSCQAERHQLESLEFVKRPVPSGWAVKRSDASRHELYGFYDEYLGPLDGWLQDPRRAVLFGNKEAAIAAQAALSVGSKLAISVVWLVYDPVFDTYREQAQ